MSFNFLDSIGSPAFLDFAIVALIIKQSCNDSKYENSKNEIVKLYAFYFTFFFFFVKTIYSSYLFIKFYII